MAEFCVICVDICLNYQDRSVGWLVSAFISYFMFNTMVCLREVILALV
jgi:hypothetical protein